MERKKTHITEPRYDQNIHIYWSKQINPYNHTIFSYIEIHKKIKSFQQPSNQNNLKQRQRERENTGVFSTESRHLYKEKTTKKIGVSCSRERVNLKREPEVEVEHIKGRSIEKFAIQCDVANTWDEGQRRQWAFCWLNRLSLMSFIDHWSRMY